MVYSLPATSRNVSSSPVLTSGSLKSRTRLPFHRPGTGQKVNCLDEAGLFSKSIALHPGDDKSVLVDEHDAGERLQPE